MFCMLVNQLCDGVLWAVHWASQMSFHSLLSWLHVWSWCPSALGLSLAFFGLTRSIRCFLSFAWTFTTTAVCSFGLTRSVQCFQFCLALHNHCCMFQHRELLFALMKLTILAVPLTDAEWKCWADSTGSQIPSPPLHVGRENRVFHAQRCSHRIQ